MPPCSRGGGGGGRYSGSHPPAPRTAAAIIKQLLLLLLVSSCHAAAASSSGLSSTGTSVGPTAPPALRRQPAQAGAWPSVSKEEEGSIEEGESIEEQEEEEVQRLVRQGAVWEAPESLTVLSRLGSGKFSEVFEAWQEGLTPPPAASSSSSTSSSFPSRRVALKVLRPVPHWRVEREVRILRWLQGGPNIIGLWGRTKTFRQALILEYLGPDARPLGHGEEGLSDFEIRLFTYQLLRALAWTHSRGVMHRDVKNKNVLVDRTSRALRLVDWGSAEARVPGKAHNTLVGTRHFKAPELLLGNGQYDYAIDVWGVGCVLAGLLFKREPFFRGVDDRDQLRRIAVVLGTEGLLSCCDKYGITLDRAFRTQLPPPNPPTKKHRSSKKGTKSKTNSSNVNAGLPGPWARYVNEGNANLCSLDALDLLGRLLRYDPAERPTAEEALEHDYFEPIRRLLAKEEEEERRRLYPFLPAD